MILLALELMTDENHILKSQYLTYIYSLKHSYTHTELRASKQALLFLISNRMIVCVCVCSYKTQ